MSRPGTAKLGKFLLLFLSFEPKQTSVRVRLTTVARLEFCCLQAHVSPASHVCDGSGSQIMQALSRGGHRQSCQSCGHALPLQGVQRKQPPPDRFRPLAKSAPMRSELKRRDSTRAS